MVVTSSGGLLRSVIKLCKLGRLAVNSLELTERKSLRKNDTSQWFEQTQRALRMKLTRHAENLKSKQIFYFLLALIAL